MFILSIFDLQKPRHQTSRGKHWAAHVAELPTLPELVVYVRGHSLGFSLVDVFFASTAGAYSERASFAHVREPYRQNLQQNHEATALRCWISTGRALPGVLGLRKLSTSVLIIPVLEKTIRKRRIEANGSKSSMFLASGTCSRGKWDAQMGLYRDYTGESYWGY